MAIVDKYKYPKIGNKLTFELKSADDPPTLDDNEGYCIAFIPLEGFRWCRYWIGSKTWTTAGGRRIKTKEIKPTEWLKLISWEE